MTGLVFRAATRADLSTIVALLADDVFGQSREATGTEAGPDYQVAFDAIAASANDQLLVAELDGRVVGCLQLTFLPGLSMRGTWRGQIESVRVARELRGTGIGRRFLTAAIDRCRARGCRLVQLTTNTGRIDAARFYRSLGFQPSHTGMKLALDPPSD